MNESPTSRATIPNPIDVNGVRYRWPERPVVVVCNDGGDPEYLDAALAAGIVPNTARFVRAGFSAIAQCVIPSFTCPNNVSIVTGSPPSVHGISGNFYLEPESGRAVVMTGPELMRAPTILAAFSRRGAKVVSITAKAHHPSGQRQPSEIGSRSWPFSPTMNTPDIEGPCTSHWK